MDTAYFVCDNCNTPLYRTYTETTPNSRPLPEDVDEDIEPDIDVDESETFLRPTVTCECDDSGHGWVLPTDTMLDDPPDDMAFMLCNRCVDPVRSIGQDGQEHYLSHYECGCDEPPSDGWYHPIPESEQGEYEPEDKAAKPISEFDALT